MAFSTTLTTNLINLVKKFEGCSLTAYHDVTGYAIGYGNHYYENGNTKVQATDRITQEKADSMLRAALQRAANSISKIITNTSVTQNQFDALVSLRYNVGAQFGSDSTVIKMINNYGPTYSGIEAEYMKWCYSGHKVVPALVKRRAIEFELYKNNKLDLNFSYSTQIFDRSELSNVLMAENANMKETNYIYTNYCNSISCDGDVEEAYTDGGVDDSVEGSSGSKTDIITKQTPRQGMNILIELLENNFKIQKWVFLSKYSNESDATKDTYVWTTDILDVKGTKVGKAKVKIFSGSSYGCEITSESQKSDIDKMRKTLIDKPDYDPKDNQESFNKILIQPPTVDNVISEFEKIIFDSKESIITPLYNYLNKNTTSYKPRLCDKGDDYIGILSASKKTGDENKPKTEFTDEGVWKYAKSRLVLFRYAHNENTAEHANIGIDALKQYFKNGTVLALIFRLPSNKIKVVQFSVPDDINNKGPWNASKMLTK